MRNPKSTVQATWFVMIILQTIGSVDLKHRLPAPKQFVAISVLWGTLFIFADTGYGKLAARLSLLVLLTASVIGPFGARLVKWLGTISKFFAITPPSTAPSAQGGSTPSITTAPSFSN